MTNQNTEERSLDWEESFDNSGSFILLAEQDCDFEVIKFERGRYDGGKKIPPCKMAILTLCLHGAEGDATVTHRLFLHTKVRGLLSAFFVSIGQAKPDDEVIRPQWDKLVGATGRCRVGVHEYVKQSGPHAGETGQSNEVTRFLPPAAPSAPSWTQGAF